jgi:colanic acid biosynthesis protein WcaH
MSFEKIPEEEYVNILEKVPVCCVDVVVKSRKRVLVVLRSNEPGKGTFAIPGGRVHKNEKLEDAAKRKVLEETGLKIRILKNLDTYETMFDDVPFKNLKTGVHTINVTFLAEPIEENAEIKIDSTSSAFKWINKIENDVHPYIRKVLKDSKVFE